MASPKIPVNQLNALPLVTADQAAAGGDVIVQGSTITRFWSNTVLGMGTTFTNLGGGGSAMSSVQLDVTGCSRFALVLTRTVTGVGGDAADLFAVYLSYGDLAGNNELPGLNTGNLSGMHDMIGRFTWAVALGNGTTVLSCQWADASVLPGHGAGQSISTVGTRVFISLRSAAVAVANRTFSAEMWGAT
jgi:hypothetical protein